MVSMAMTGASSKVIMTRTAPTPSICPNVGVLAVRGGVQADGLAALQVGLAQNLPHGGGISGGLLGVEVPGFQDGSILRGNVALLPILQLGQSFGFAFC